MKKGKLLVAIGVVLLLTVGFTTFPVVNGFAKPAKPITLNFVSFIALSNVEFTEFKRLFIDRVNEKGKGELTINVRGGPETIAAFDLGVAVQKGTVDMAIIPTAFFESLVPGADATRLSRLTEEEERKAGAHDFIQGMYEKGGMYYLGRQQPTHQDYFYMFLNKRVEKPEDFVGLKLGGSTAFHAHFKGLGATPITLPMPEYYPAMERGVVDGISTSLHMWAGYGGHEVTKYMIDHPFYKNTVSVVANLKTWNQLPKHLQKLMIECMLEEQKEWPDLSAKAWKKEKQKMRDGGVEIITFPPDVAKWFVETALEEAWKDEEERFGEVIPKLKKLLTK
ncbi:MAG: TRAP transporter substrate-binding protein DctP [Candidatus Hodarchaeota archaeon]